MSLALHPHPATPPGPPRSLFVTGWALRQAVLPLAAAALFDLSAGGNGWAWMLALSICCMIVTALIREHAWALPMLPAATARVQNAPDVFLVVSEVLAHLFITVLVFALALSSSLWGMAAAMWLAAALLGHSVADAVTRFLRVSGLLQQFMIARLVTSAALVTVSVTPAFLAAHTGTCVTATILAVGAAIVLTGALTIAARRRGGRR